MVGVTTRAVVVPVVTSAAIVIISIIIMLVTFGLVFFKTHHRKMPGQYTALLV